MSALPSRAARAPRKAIHHLRATLLSARDLLVTAGPVLLLALGAIVVAYWLLDPTPPRQMTLATGPDQGAYAEFGKRYREALKKEGIDVRLQSSRGALENLRLLRDGKVDAAFVQGGAEALRGLDDEDPPEGLLSLGSLFREPVWVFYREAAAQAAFNRTTLDSLSQLAQWKLNIGHEGSGVTNLMRRLLEANGLDTRQMQLGRLEPTPAVVALLDGQIDAMALVSAPESPLVRMLLITPGIRLLDFAQAEAYARRVPQVQPITLPRGVVDLAQDLPAQDVRLVAPTATLLVREGTHPALQQLLVQAARRIHGEPNWFQHKNEFPQMGASEYALAPEAQRFYESGAPLLQRYLPFWVANLIDRMWVVLVSIAALLIPLSRIVPPLYTFRIRSRIFRWYGTLRDIEERAGASDRSEADTRALIDELAELDTRVERLPVPLSHAEELYALRSHIRLVQRRLGEG
ncbi:MAG TPA: TAXI family TRAP transporter solute-binding subunit [Burkholderiaceae bacterium]|nr:TAXI family TRAP transporter solute-binding subunit [Burkholderiaceae bacterium]HMX10176.1 TAXI family TRAP transporter solute-binding subunit [Burkholderiaceae bacterium]HNB43949.1 TAXI family TRAP transporter solute-binding subunit [Burkholderiaceae bacterium]